MICTLCVRQVNTILHNKVPGTNPDLSRVTSILKTVRLAFDDETGSRTQFAQYLRI